MKTIKTDSLHNGKLFFHAQNCLKQFFSKIQKQVVDTGRLLRLLRPITAHHPHLTPRFTNQERED